MTYEIVKKKHYFSKIINNKKFFKSNLFITFYVFDKKIKNINIGISVKKTTGIAVTRNKIKRKIRKCLRERFDVNLKGKIIIICKKDIKNMKDKIILEDLKMIMKGINLLYNKSNNDPRPPK